MSRNSLAQPGESASQKVSKVSSSRQLLGMAMTASSQRSASGLLMLKMAAVRRTRQWSGGGGAKVGRDVKVDSVVDDQTMWTSTPAQWRIIRAAVNPITTIMEITTGPTSSIHP